MDQKGANSPVELPSSFQSKNGHTSHDGDEGEAREAARAAVCEPLAGGGGDWAARKAVQRHNRTHSTRY